MWYFSTGSSHSVGACESPGPHFHPADPGGAGDVNSHTFRDIQASRELREASSLPHTSKVCSEGGGARISPAEAELDHTRCPGAPAGDEHFPFSLY